MLTVYSSQFPLNASSRFRCNEQVVMADASKSSFEIYSIPSSSSISSIQEFFFYKKFPNDSETNKRKGKNN
uniref:Uncharacterized protein n=1 Tax=Onchocerca volvulus TaxID=6282 RepID=A0A8R1TIC6_ONCVO